MNNIDVTILLATYNGEKYIEEQLLSILNQTYKNFKILIRDDLSTDNTFNILKKYEKKYPNIKVIKNEKRLGTVKNFEKLIIDANTPYIALSDQDDVWLENKLELAIDAIKKEHSNKPVLVHSDLEVVDENLNTLYKSFFRMRNYEFYDYRSIDVCLGRCGVMGNTVVFNQKLKGYILPFPKDLIVHDYWIALINEFFGKRVTINKALVKYRIHKNNTSKRFKRKNITLPYHNINRERVLNYLILNYQISSEDKNLIELFISYLLLKKMKLKNLYSFFYKYNFFRKGFLYRTKVLILYLIKSIK